MFFFPAGTERFHFPALPSIQLCIYCKTIRYKSNWVTPFGNPWIKACLTATQGLSQPTTSFIGLLRQGIHHMLFVRLIEITFYSVLNVQLKIFWTLLQILDLPQQQKYAKHLVQQKLKISLLFLISMDLRRVELLTSSLQMKRSSQLNYRPLFRIWWAHQESNLGPQSYQDCALTSWAIRPSRYIFKELSY